MKKIFTSAVIAAMTLAANVASAQVSITPALDANNNPTFDVASASDVVYLYATESMQQALAGKITGDQNADDNSRFLDIWKIEGTDDLTYLTPGLKINGEPVAFANDSNIVNTFGGHGFICFRVGNGGWSGGGFRGVVDAAKDADGYTLDMIDDSYYFHFAMMDNGTVYANHEFKLGGSDKRSALFTVGTKASDKKHVIVGDFPRDGKWYNFDIPVSYLEEEMGLDLREVKNYGNYVLTFSSGGTKDACLYMDAIFFYKKDTSGIQGVTTANTKKGIYTLDGRRVDQMGANGLYIVNGKKVVK